MLLKLSSSILAFRSLACRMNSNILPFADMMYWKQSQNHLHTHTHTHTHTMKYYPDMSIIFCLLRWAEAGKDLGIERPKRMCVYLCWASRSVPACGWTMALPVHVLITEAEIYAPLPVFPLNCKEMECDCPSSDLLARCFIEKTSCWSMRCIQHPAFRRGRSAAGATSESYFKFGWYCSMLLKEDLSECAPG
ncbi:hypothetical protein DKX38_015221 [Salix brachista]|uniref:Uncharacterized protein n=1 Tax=Salix brachista TaxID=2182728 RepID=A0A5N5L5A1_9ROSI|nr:hypothetical protein DKX38_015221 [Salix brachista]